MTWGTGAWGTGEWGSTSQTLSITSAIASSTHTIRVTLSSTPQRISGFKAGDVFNPSVWAVKRLDTDEVFTVLGVREVDHDLIYDILLLEPLASHNVQHRVESTTLLSSNGTPIDAPRFADFAGILAFSKSTPENRAAKRGFVLRDLSNPPAPSTVNSLAGTLVINDDGDYQLEQGVALLRKLIFRRLITRPGDFYHLPNYGIGFRVKEPIPLGDLVMMEAKIRQQVQLEPEIQSVDVQLAQSSNSLTIVVRAKLKASSEPVTFGFETPFEGVTL